MTKTEDDLIQLLGSWGEYIYKVFRGETTNKILPRGDRKSISHERTFIGKPGEVEKYLEIIDKLFNSTYEGFLDTNFYTKTVDLKIRFNGFDTITRSKSLPSLTKNRELLYRTTKEIVKPYLNDSRGIRLLGVGFSNLEKIDDAQAQLDDWFNDSSVDNFDLPQGFSVLDILKQKQDREKQKSTPQSSLDDFF